MTTRDGVPAAAVHKAFLAINEYREAMPPDARQPPKAASVNTIPSEGQRTPVSAAI